jgi:hypothetical protein
MSRVLAFIFIVKRLSKPHFTHLQHLQDFHDYMNMLGIIHEDVLMKLFMFSLERDARKWFRGLPPKSISSLKYFHSCFHNHCRLIY